MDLNDFWQENKRWVLCCLAGLIVFLVAYNIVDSAYVEPVKSVSNRASSNWRNVGNKRFSPKQLDQAKTDRAAIQSTLGALRGAMQFELDERFNLAGKGAADLYYSKVYVAVRNKIFEDADRLDVEFEEKAFSWAPEKDRAQIQRRLIGISLVEHSVNQLLAAHSATLEADFSAIGLRSIDNFQIDRARNKRTRPKKKDEPIKAEELLSEIAVKFKFTADAATLHRFLENLRTARPRVTIGKFQVVPGRQNGDPVVVSGEIQALTIQPLDE